MIPRICFKLHFSHTSPPAQLAPDDGLPTPTEPSPPVTSSALAHVSNRKSPTSQHAASPSPKTRPSIPDKKSLRLPGSLPDLRHSPAQYSTTQHSTARNKNLTTSAPVPAVWSRDTPEKLEKHPVRFCGRLHPLTPTRGRVVGRAREAKQRISFGGERGVGGVWAHDVTVPLPRYLRKSCGGAYSSASRKCLFLGGRGGKWMGSE